MSTSETLILFSLSTPGHLINSLSIIGELEKEGNLNHYYLLDFYNGSKSVTGIQKFKFSKEKFTVVTIENFQQLFLNTLNPILNLRFNRVFIFLEYRLENAFLAAHYKKKGSHICLANDGNRPYYRINRRALKSKIVETLKFYFKAFSNKLPTVPFYIYNLKYGNLKYIDEYWIPYSISDNELILSGNVRIYKLLNEESIKLIKTSYFNIKEVESPPFPTANIIFYMNNMLYRKEAYIAEIDALMEIKKNINAPLIIKMHPATPNFQIEAFKIVGDYVFKSAIPAELYMMQIKNSIFLSGWSSSLLFDNRRNCSYYWLYNYFIDNGLVIKDLVDFSLPDTHIQHPLSLKKIKLL